MNRRLGWLVAVLAGVALLVTGCAWGVVTDAETGAPVEGASVIYVDSEGSVNAKLTGEGGHYQFNAIAGDRIPATGLATFIVLATGYQTLVVQRELAYDDSDLHIWEVQSFELTRQPTPTPTPTSSPAPTATPSPTPTLTPTPTVTPSPTSTATATPTATPTATATPS